MKLTRKNKVNTAIPTASMPDIIFMLLIFFMVSTVLKQYSGLKVKLPDAELVKKIPGSKRHVVTIWVDKNNAIMCNDYKVNKVTELRNVLYQKRLENPQIIIALKADRDSDMGIVSDVQQEMRKADALKVNYSATPGVI